MASKEASKASFGESRDIASHKEAFKQAVYFADKPDSAQYMLLLFIGITWNVVLAELCPSQV